MWKSPLTTGLLTNLRKLGAETSYVKPDTAKGSLDTPK